MSHLDTQWLFSTKYDQLQRLANSTEVGDFLQIAAWLRSFLLEGELTGEVANRSYGLTIKFPVLPTSTYTGPDGQAGPLFSDSFFKSETDEKGAQHVNRDEFLRVPVLQFEGATYDVADVVRAAANVGGAIHSKPDPKNAHLIELTSRLFVSRRSEGLAALQAIVRHVVPAYSHLRRVIEGRIGDLRQDDPAKQPKLSSQGILFSAGAYLEDAVKPGLGKDVLIGLRVALKAVDATERYILDMGSLDPTKERLSLKAFQGNLIASFRDKRGQHLIVRHPCSTVDALMAVTVNVITHWDQQTTISLGVDRQQTHAFQDGIKFIELEGKQILGANLKGKQSGEFTNAEFVAASGMKTAGLSVRDVYNLREYLIRRNIEDTNRVSAAS